MSDKYRNFITLALYWGLLLLLCWIGVRYVLLWLLPFLIALGVAYIMEPMVCAICGKSCAYAAGLCRQYSPSCCWHCF